MSSHPPSTHTAMGQRCRALYPGDWILSVTNPPAEGNEWSSPYLGFDDGSAEDYEFCYADLRMPEDRIAGTKIIPRLWFYPDNIPNGQQGTTVYWQLYVYGFRIGDWLATHRWTYATLEGISPGVLGSDYVTEVSFNHKGNPSGDFGIEEHVDSPHAGGRPNLQITLLRWGSDPNDTMPGDARFLKLLFYYTARH